MLSSNSFRAVHVPTIVLWKLALYYAPFLYNNSIYLITFITTLFLFYRLTESNELIIILCNGVSIWKILLLLSSIVLILGLFAVTVVNPIATYGFQKRQQLKLRLTKEIKRSDITVLSSDTLIREESSNENRIIKVQAIDLHKKELKGLIVLFFNKNNDLLKRIDAQTAIIKDGNLKLINSKVIYDKSSEDKKEISFPTSLSFNNFTYNLRNPESMTIPELKKTINQLIANSIPATDYEQYYYKELCKPFIMLVTTILASMFFSLKNYHHYRSKLLFLGLCTGIVFYAILEIFIKILFHYNIHPSLAVLLPNFFILFVGIFMILHLHES